MDLNNDGIADLLSGSYSRNEQPMAGLFQVLWGQAEGEFSKAKTLTGSDGKDLEIPHDGEDQVTESICTRPFAVDWNGDSLLDLIVGVFSGSFYLFRGEEGNTFSPIPVRLEGEGAPLKVDGAHGDPFVIDWDGDGDLDLISGSDHGGVQWAENLAEVQQAPQLSGFKPLIPGRVMRGSSELVDEDSLTGPEHAYRVWIDDLNSDGKLDFLVGDNVTLRRVAEGVSEEDFPVRYREWEKRFSKVSEELQSFSEKTETESDALNAIRERFQKIYEGRQEFMVEERTGYIWVFLQK